MVSSTIQCTVAAENRQCSVALAAEPQHIVGGERSFVIQSDAIRCGTESQPWSIEALAGQRIAASLIDFGEQMFSFQISWRFNEQSPFHYKLRSGIYLLIIVQDTLSKLSLPHLHIRHPIMPAALKHHLSE
jgi:hypothetical protein